jgi:hypothetical protein
MGEQMRRVVTLLVVFGCIAPSVAASQARTAAAAGALGTGACAALTRDMVAPFSENKQVLDLIPPREEPIGKGTACDWGGVRLQLFAIPRSEQKRTPPVKEMQVLAGAGEAGFFRSNRDRFAELAVYSATHYIMLQVSVPTGKTAEAIKPDAVKLANAIIAKLR